MPVLWWAQQVGDISVLSFGESVRMLHSFDEPFSDDAGARVVSSFSFKQRSTHMASTLRSIVGLLDEAKHNLRMSSTR